MNKNYLQIRKVKTALLFALLSCTLYSFALDYNISFTASGASSTIDNVVIQNITQGKTVTVPAGNALTLTGAILTNINECSGTDDYLEIFPNPINEKATLSFYSKSTGITQVNIYHMDGRKVGGLVLKTEEGVNQFQIALPNGIYILQVAGNDYSYKSKIISQASTATQVKINHIGIKNTQPTTLQKTKNAGITFSYSAGDILLFKASSGNFTTLKSDIVNGSKTINFNFVECMDADGNYYPVVNIGTQTWMAENLKTSQYRNAVAITNQSNNTGWGTLSTEGFSDYSTPSNSTTYGKFYNWYATNDSKKLAPLGWHIPTDAEWTLLSNYLGGTNVAGSKLKEAGNTHWLTSNADATNEQGFSGIPGGTRSTDGSTYDMGNTAYWWSSTVGTNTNSAWYRSIANLSGSINRGFYSKNGGMSVRCVLGDVPVLSTAAISCITATTAASGGNISFDWNSLVTARGVCWSTTSSPTITDNKTTDSIGTGVFTSALSGLVIGTTYYVRAYATNSIGTAYGEEVSFTTTLPTVSTTAISALTPTTATSGGNVTAIGGAAVTSRGISLSTTPNPTIELSTEISDGAGLGTFTSSITGLIEGTTYYVRAYATNSVGTTYGNQISFTTLTSVTTTAISAITDISASSGGNATSTGGAAVTARGVCWSTSTNPTIANSKTSDATGTGAFTSAITGLASGTTYYVRAYATNNSGTSYGDEVTLTTLPSVTTSAVFGITINSASSGGSATSTGVAAVTAKGVCWSTIPNPTTALATKTSEGTGNGTFTSAITGLVKSTTYYVRAYATNATGTNYGMEYSFFTPTYSIGDALLGGKVAFVDASGQHGFVCALADQSIGASWGNAFSICDVLTDGGAAAGDWNLPSKDELNQMYVNKTLLGGFTMYNYWSSSEKLGANLAWCQDFNRGNQSTSFKTYICHVRAIRAF